MDAFQASLILLELYIGQLIDFMALTHYYLLGGNPPLRCLTQEIAQLGQGNDGADLQVLGEAKRGYGCGTDGDIIKNEYLID